FKQQYHLYQGYAHYGYPIYLYRWAEQNVVCPGRCEDKVCQRNYTRSVSAFQQPLAAIYVQRPAGRPKRMPTNCLPVLNIGELRNALQAEVHDLNTGPSIWNVEHFGWYKAMALSVENDIIRGAEKENARRVPFLLNTFI